MKLDASVRSARAADSNAFGKIGDNRAVKIVRAAFQAVNSELETVEEGELVISGLGRFVIKSVEREKEGAKSKTRRVTFRQRKAN